MAAHKPDHFATALGSKLAAGSRHVCMLLGAGVGKACELPDMTDLKRCVLKNLSCNHREVFERMSEHRTLEEVLTRLRRISALLDAKVDDLTADDAAELDDAICNAIVRSLSPSGKTHESMQNIARWAIRANYDTPLEFFSINYDLLLEEALDSVRATYFDGFMGTLEARFQSELVEALPGTADDALPSFLIRVWKLHGSLNWTRKNGEIVRLGQPVENMSAAAAIYPSDAKYEESRRVPFVVLQDRLRRSLNQPETLLLISGYSFGDDHLNELVFDSAIRRQRSEYIAFCYEEIPEELGCQAENIPNLQAVSKHEAILGGVRGEWQAQDEDKGGLWQDGFTLHDFRSLAEYLAKSTAYNFGHEDLPTTSGE